MPNKPQQNNAAQGIVEDRRTPQPPANMRTEWLPEQVGAVVPEGLRWLI